MCRQVSWVSAAVRSAAVNDASSAECQHIECSHDGRDVHGDTEATLPFIISHGARDDGGIAVMILAAVIGDGAFVAFAVVAGVCGARGEVIIEIPVR